MNFNGLLYASLERLEITEVRQYLMTLGLDLNQPEYVLALPSGFRFMPANIFALL